MSEQAKHMRLRAAIEACPFKSWAAFTDDCGSQPHTNLVSFTDRTECVLPLPGLSKREPLVEYLAAATPKAVGSLLAERDDLLETIKTLRDYVCDVVREHLFSASGMDITGQAVMDLERIDAAIAKATGEQQ